MNAPMSDARLGLLTATPDLVAAGLLPALVERLAIEGLRPLAALPHVYSPAETFMLYDGKSTHPRSDRARIQRARVRPRRKWFELIGMQRPRPAFGHLAAARVPGAQEQDLQPR